LGVRRVAARSPIFAVIRPPGHPRQRPIAAAAAAAATSSRAWPPTAATLS